MRKVDAVAVTKLDRLGRSLQHLLTLVGELEALGVDFISLDDGLDTSTPVGRLFFQIRGAFAEYERSLIAERAAAGRAAAKRRGVQFGRRSTLPPASAARVGRLHSSGHSVREIAKVLGIGKDVVHREIVRLRARDVAEQPVSKVPMQMDALTVQKSAV
jgi:DNA invertase Pin-like site-specific DNA recombinase